MRLSAEFFRCMKSTEMALENVDLPQDERGLVTSCGLGRDLGLRRNRSENC